MISSDILERRERQFGPNAPLFYDRPLHMVRGSECWMWDADGNRYLDCYNNVPHVGHCHPHVVDALCKQASTLNIHTRYLNEVVLQYAERLTGLLPSPQLDRAMFVCTGTEANELALRIARHASGNRGVLVSDFSYHGNSSGFAELTTGLPHPEPMADFVRSLKIPDPYRWEGSEDEMVAHHLALVDDAIESLTEAGFGVATVIFDTIFSTEGLLDVPPAYVQGVAQRVRDAGGLFIADEVQPGFGRMGDAMWGFESTGVTPDLVTMGKPMGNGHPVGAVVTSSALADAFTGDALYFNTFGGNPVSAAAGNAVLDVIEREDLVHHSATVGQYLQERLKDVASKFNCAGDVRGRGLFAAVELVGDGKQPEARLAKAVINEMRNRQILISKIGPADNVLKIRPPLCLGTEEVDLLADALSSTIGTLAQ
ncbi:aspartate aminotransferase family protein [Aurantiacibacter flavus]|uniref:Aspartate aminotransferase family protein n=1 Tax=Aurantiacibacter flavus TaxID=3145232 RepID=A0ABV0CV45_9SPHN